MYKIGTVGVVGPEKSVERILDISKEFETSLEFVPYIYNKISEIKEIILNSDRNVDTWLFSGPVPYIFARDLVSSHKKMFYISGTELGIYKAILDYVYDQKEVLDKASIDFPKDLYPIEEILKQLDVPPKEIYLKSFDSKITSEELVDFHLDLWKKGKIQGALTCLPSISEELRRYGVPSYWVTTSRLDTRQTIKIITENMKSSYFKSTQIGVEVIEVENFDKVINKMKSTYFLQHLELRLKEILINLCERIDGSLSDRGNGRYVVISTRGAIEREIAVLKDTILQMSVEADMTISVGIGYGKTVLSAEVNAYNAMQQSREKAERGIVIIQENGVVVEYNDIKDVLMYSPRTDDKELLEKLKSGNISIRTYKKIYALVHKMKWSQFTIKDISTNLQMTERNSRRIISDLCKVGLVDLIGEEDFSSRGRPSKIYSLK